MRYRLGAADEDRYRVFRSAAREACCTISEDQVKFCSGFGLTSIATQYTRGVILSRAFSDLINLSRRSIARMAFSHQAGGWGGGCTPDSE